MVSVNHQPTLPKCGIEHLFSSDGACPVCTRAILYCLCITESTFKLG